MDVSCCLVRFSLVSLDGKCSRPNCSESVPKRNGRNNGKRIRGISEGGDEVERVPCWNRASPGLEFSPSKPDVG